MTTKPPPSTAALCSFCGSTPAAVSVGKTKLCLLHHYTTLNGRNTANPITVLDESVYAEQAPAVQELFASVYLQVREELQEATVRNNQDPLGILNQLSSSRKQLQQQHKQRTKRAGGFMPKLPPPPARLQAVQDAQKRAHDALVQRMNGKAADLTQRRQPTRKSIWNSVLNHDKNGKSSKTNKKSNNNNGDVEESFDNLQQANTTVTDMVCSSCQSTNVECLHSTERRQDMAKAETWSNKDREGEISNQYRCGQCGKVWHEQE